jgi:hypothetical protein
MGRHHQDDPQRRGGLRWKGDTTDSLPVLPAWATHEGITDESVDTFIAAIHSTNPPGTDAPAEHARFSWMIERCSERGVDGSPVRRNSWVTMATGYCAQPYPTCAEAALQILTAWFMWNGVTDPQVRALHTIWVRHATEAAWTERLDGQ